MELGITITAPNSSGFGRTEDAYGSLLQLVIMCKYGNKLEAHEWEELNIALSGVMHPFAVDILSGEDFGEDAEARFQV